MSNKRRWFPDVLLNGGRALGNLLRRRHRDLGFTWITLQGSLPEIRTRPAWWDPFLGRLYARPGWDLQALRSALDRLAGDGRVQGLVFDLASLQAGPATLQTLRQELSRLHRAGKQVVAHLPGAGTWAYYLATAADKIVLPEGSSLHTVGLRLETQFLGDFLSSLGIRGDFEAIGRYKVTPDLLTRSSISQPHQEMLEGLLESLYTELVVGIAEGRRMTRREVEQALDDAPLTAEEAMAAGLVDTLVPQHALSAYLGGEDETPPVQPWSQTRRAVRRPLRWRSRQRIGIVPVQGTIVLGRSQKSPLPIPFFRQMAGHQTIMQALRQAARDRHIGAVILLIDSPGGVALAADLIWHEMRRLGEDKPVVACLQDQATSGGYYLASAAQAIVAQPLTVTGSIGIFSGKLVDAGLMQRLGIGRYCLGRGRHSGIYSSETPFSPEERERVRVLLQDGYQRFKARVAEGRKRSPRAIEEVAQGRIWTGRQALELGLVDELGGLRLALQRAAKLAGIPPHLEPEVVLLQPPRRFLPPVPSAASLDALQSLAETASAARRLFAQPVLALCPWEFRLWDGP